MNICRVSQEEMKHDGGGEAKKPTAVEIADRVEEILGACGLDESEDKAMIKAEVIDSDYIIDHIVGCGWLFKAHQDIDSLPLKEIRHMALVTQVIVDRISKIARASAESE